MEPWAGRDVSIGGDRVRGGGGQMSQVPGSTITTPHHKGTRPADPNLWDPRQDRRPGSQPDPSLTNGAGGMSCNNSNNIDSRGDSRTGTMELAPQRNGPLVNNTPTDLDVVVVPGEVSLSELEKSLRNPEQRLIPEEEFAVKKVETIIRDVLEAFLRNVRYDPSRCSRLAQDLCSMVRDKTKELQSERYKLVAQVLIGQNTDHSVLIASRCLWNQTADSFAAATYRNDTLYAVGMVFGMHLDYPDKTDG